MANHPDRIVVWPGYFDSKTSRRSGRRVSKDRSVANPTLDGLAYAARNAGIKKMKREDGVSHPARPSEKEGRLWISIKDAQSATGTDSKEESCKRLEVLGTPSNLKPKPQRRRPRSVDQRRVTSEVEVNANPSKARRVATE